MAFGLVLVTAATQYALPDRSLPSRFAAALLNFIVAVPLIASGGGAVSHPAPAARTAGAAQACANQKHE